MKKTILVLLSVFISMNAYADNEKTVKTMVHDEKVSTTSIPTNKQIKIAVFNGDKMTKEGLVWADAESQIRKRREFLTSRAEERHNKIKVMKENLEKDKATLTLAEKEKKMNEIVSEENKFNEMNIAEQKDLLLKAGEAQAQIIEKIYKLIEVHAKKNGYQIVFNSILTTFYVDESLDMTQQIIKDLNKILPSLKIEFGKNISPDTKTLPDKKTNTEVVRTTSTTKHHDIDTRRVQEKTKAPTATATN